MCLFADLEHFYNGELASLQAMLVASVGCRNAQVQEAVCLLRRRIVDLPRSPSSFFDVVADIMQSHPDTTVTYAGNTLRILVYRYLMEQKRILEVFIIYPCVNHADTTASIL